MPELPYIKNAGARGDLQVCIVDGAYIRIAAAPSSR